MLGLTCYCADRRATRVYTVSRRVFSVHSGWDKWFHSTLRVASGATLRSIPWLSRGTLWANPVADYSEVSLLTRREYSYHIM